MVTTHQSHYPRLPESSDKIFTGLQLLEAKPSKSVSLLLERSGGVVKFDTVIKLLEHPGWPLVDKIIKNSKQASSLCLIEVKFLDNGNCEIALSESPGYRDLVDYSNTRETKILNTPIRIITFSNSEIIEDTTRLPIGTPRLVDGPRQPQGGIDSIDDMARHIPDAAALINGRMSRGI